MSAIRRSSGLPTGIEDRAVYDSAVRHLREARVVLPTFEELADPAAIPGDIAARTMQIDRDAADPANLFRVHWFNDVATGGIRAVPPHVVLPRALTGVDAPIAVALGNSFPMIGAHKVLAAYACLVSRLVTGRFDPARNKAVWPSTGNYCRGGVAISRIMAVRGMAVLPEGMSAERFDWLREWIEHPRRHRPHAGLREQRQGNLRRVRRAGARSGQRDPQPVFRVRQLSRPLPLHRTRPAGDPRPSPPRQPRSRARRLRGRHRFGRDARRRRPSEGSGGRPDRRGRASRMPDHAL